MKGWVRRHPLSSFFCLAYAVSWSIGVPLALQAQGLVPSHLPWSLHYLTAFGPAAAALVVGRLLREPAAGGVRARPAACDARTAWWWTVGFASPLLLFAAARAVARLSGAAVPAWTSLGHVNFLPDLGLMAWGLWFVTSGLGEELGWRGFGLPRLQRTHPAMTSTLLLAIGWAGWHLPAFFYVPSYTAIGLRLLPGFFLGLLAGAIVLTWLYNNSGGSVLAVALWHASFNFVTASPDAGEIAAAVISGLVMIWAFVLLWRYDWATLSNRRDIRSVRARRNERSRALPGDRLIPRPIASLQHGITIRRARHDVWPWIAQMGAGTRAGWYSYDVLDNGGRASAERIDPGLQALSLGMIFPALPGATDGFTLLAFEPEHSLVLGWIAPGGERLMTWAFVLEDAGPDSTRLLVRARGGPGYRFHGVPWWATRPVVTLVHFIMQRRQLLGIARRAEAQPCVSHSSSSSHSHSRRSTGSRSGAGSAAGAPRVTSSRA